MVMIPKCEADHKMRKACYFLNGGVVTTKDVEVGVLYSGGREALMAVYFDGTQQRGRGEGGVHVAGWIRG